jgi:hypothetical protein
MATKVSDGGWGFDSYGLSSLSIIYLSLLLDCSIASRSR